MSEGLIDKKLCPECGCELEESFSRQRERLQKEIDKRVEEGFRKSLGPLRRRARIFSALVGGVIGVFMGIAVALSPICLAYLFSDVAAHSQDIFLDFGKYVETLILFQSDWLSWILVAGAIGGYLFGAISFFRKPLLHRVERRLRRAIIADVLKEENVRIRSRNISRSIRERLLMRGDDRDV